MINFLELLGISYEGQLADKDILLRVFREFVVEQYQALELCTLNLTNHSKSGRDMLYESRAAVSMYEALRKEDLERDKPAKIREE